MILYCLKLISSTFLFNTKLSYFHETIKYLLGNLFLSNNLQKCWHSQQTALWWGIENSKVFGNTF